MTVSNLHVERCTEQQLSGRKVGLVKNQVTPKVSLCAEAATSVVRLLI